MPIDTRDNREKRRKLILSARALFDKADEEKRTLTGEERGQHDKVWGEAETLRNRIEDDEKRNNLEREEEAGRLRQKEEDSRKKAGEKEETTREFTSPRDTDEYLSAYGKFLTAHNGSYLDSRNFSAEEQRALSAGTATEGGFLYAPEQFAEGLIADVTDATIFRQLARGIQIGSADSLGVPTLTDRMAAAVWTSELGVPSTDSTLAVGKRAMTPHPLAKEIRVSKTLLRKVPNAQALVRSELARVVSEANENAFMTGTGAQQPLGIFVASDDGIPTSRDVATSNTAATPTFDGLKSAQYELKQVYWAAAQWIFHRDIMELIAKLKDGNGRYLLQDSVVQSEPDRMLGFPIRLSEFCPNTVSANLYVGMLGDYDNYWIVDALDMQISRAEELYIRQNQDLFIIRMETDGAPVRSEAFVRVKLGAS